MTDAIQVLKPGWRALDANGNPYPGALLQFFDAGTSNTREVFSNYDLDASLGVDVECDAGGYPTSDGSTKVEVYTGNTPYKITLKDADGATIWQHDNIIGALDTSEFLTDEDVVPETPVSNTSTNQAPALADKGTYYNVNCSGGDVTITLDNASDLDDGWFIKVRHDGTANQVLLVTTSGELLKIGSHAGVPAFALTQRGQVVTITCDGVGFKVEQSSPALFNTTGVIAIADRLAVAPGSPEAGARYIATAADTWGALSVVEHDIVEADGQGNFFAIAPPTDCGWIAYVQDEDLNYQMRGAAWTPLAHPASDTLAGLLEIAVQSEMEAASSLGLAVVPGRQHHHPGHPKAGGNFNGGGTPTFVSGDYGMGAITDHGTGDYTLALDTAFADTNYWANGFARSTSTSLAVIAADSGATKTTSAFRVHTGTNSNSTADLPEAGINFWGDYA